MSAVEFATKRLICTGLESLQSIQKEGATGLWRQLKALAKGELTQDKVCFSFKEGIEASHFKGFTGFFRRMAEAFKVFWANLTGKFDDLVQKAQEAINLNKMAASAASEVEAASAALKAHSDTVIAERAARAKELAYKHAAVDTTAVDDPQAFIQSVAKAFDEQSFLAKEQKNIAKRLQAGTLTNGDLHKLLQSHLKSAGAMKRGDGGAVDYARVSALESIFEKHGIKLTRPKVGEPFNPVGSTESTDAVLTNIRQHAGTVDEVCEGLEIGYVGKDGKNLLPAFVKVPKLVDPPVQLSDSQDLRLLRLYRDARKQEINIKSLESAIGEKIPLHELPDVVPEAGLPVGEIAPQLVRYMKEKPTEFLAEYAKHFSADDADKLRLLNFAPKNAAEGATEVLTQEQIAQKTQDYINHLHAALVEKQDLGVERATYPFMRGLTEMLADPMLLSKMPETFKAIL